MQKGSGDPESERLLSDNISGAAVSENGSVCIKYIEIVQEKTVPSLE